MRRLLIALTACSVLAGCGLVMNTPRYSVHVSNTLALREAGLAKVSIGEIAKDPDARRDVDHVKARAMTLGSSFGGGGFLFQGCCSSQSRKICLS